MNKEVVYRWEMDASELGDVKPTPTSPLTYSLRESPDFFVAGVPWMLKVCTDTEVVGNEERIYFILNCIHEDMSVPWTIEQTSTITLVNSKPEEKTVFNFVDPFSNSEPEWSVHVMYAELFNEANGFIIDGNITLEARVMVKKMTGIRQSIELDFTSPGVGSDDVVLVVQERKLHVSKNYLSLHSPYFTSLFFKNFKETNKSEIALPEVSYNSVVDLLYVIYPSYRPITHWSIFGILDVADRFDVKYARDQSEIFLIATTRFDLARKLWFADKYRLELVQTHCLSLLDTHMAFKDLEAKPVFKEFSLELRSTLFDKLLEILIPS